jgi:nicotinate dehydrogenase subunit B
MNGMDRRDFLKTLGGGLFVFVTLGEGEWLVGLEPQRRGYPTDINAYLHIAEDGRVTLYSGKIEMGQGVMTSLAQMAAEELGVATERFEVIMGDTDTCPYDSGTYGSLTTRMFGPAVRAASAKAREVLLEMAAERLGVPVSTLQVGDGVVSVTAQPARRVSFAQLVGGQQITRTLDREAVLHSVREFKEMGRPLGRLDAMEKVTGAAKYAGDIRPTGLLHARLLRPPAHGATLRKVDTAAAERLPGVTVVKEDDLIAVLHADPEAADRALAQVNAEWDVPEPTVDTESIYDHLVARAAPGRANDERGDLAAGRAAARILVEETWRDGYVAHAPMEPHTSTAVWEGGRMTVWASTQSPFPTQQSVARAIGVEASAVRVITPYVGGGFGGKTAGAQSVEAARLAKTTGRPVQVRWSRAEEFFYDTFRPAAVVTISSGLDAAGRICLWDYHVYSAGSRGSEQLYDVPNNRILVSGEWGGGGGSVHPFAVGAWRAPGASTNTFARESQIDILAARAGVDPVSFRLDHITEPRLKKTLETAVERFGWTPAISPSGRGIGVACGFDAETYIAHLAQVEVDASTGRVKVVRVVCAQDMGIVVNPMGATMQIEGCIAMGLGYTLAETIRFRGGEILDRNFDTYQLPRFSWMPRIETVLVSNDGLDPKGGGEPAIVCMGAVIANAIFDATGARLRRLPMIPERVLKAISERRGG